MKWYWAILLTVAILAIFVLVDIPEGPAAVVIALFAIWVAADSSSFTWGILVLFAWPVAYPWYLIVGPKVLSGVGHLSTKPAGSIIEWLAGNPSVEEMFSRAVKLDQRGDWADAIAVFERIAERRKGQQDGEYARNCAQYICEKMKMASGA